MPKLHARLPADMELEIRRSAVREKLRKGAMMRELLTLARANPDEDPVTFDGADAVPCTLDMSTSALDTYQEYRIRFGLDENAAFFRHALFRGLAAYRRIKGLTPNNVVPMKGPRGQAAE